MYNSKIIILKNLLNLGRPGACGRLRVHALQRTRHGWVLKGHARQDKEPAGDHQEAR